MFSLDWNFKLDIFMEYSSYNFHALMYVSSIMYSETCIWIETSDSNVSEWIFFTFKTVQFWVRFNKSYWLGRINDDFLASVSRNSNFIAMFISFFSKRQCKVIRSESESLLHWLNSRATNGNFAKIRVPFSRPPDSRSVGQVLLNTPQQNLN